MGSALRNVLHHATCLRDLDDGDEEFCVRPIMATQKQSTSLHFKMIYNESSLKLVNTLRLVKP